MECKIFAKVGMEEMTAPPISFELRRVGHIIIIEGLDKSITFHPTDKDKTLKEILEKCKEFDYDLTENNPECVQELTYIDSQLTQIYEVYDEEKTNQKRDPELLLGLLQTEIKDQFRDETGAYNVIIERDNHADILAIDSEEFDMFMRNVFFKNTDSVLGKESASNTKMLLKSFTNKQKKLYNRVAKIGYNILYDLGNENRNCIKVSKNTWTCIDNPCIFRRFSFNDRTQVYPVRSGVRKRYLKDILDKSTIKYSHQRLLAEVYIISLFIADIAHPMILAIGPPGSGKTVLLRTIKLIADPLDQVESLVQRLPRDDRDRRVGIYKNFISYFDNETTIEPRIMDELCTWVTGYSGTVRVLHTTDESRTYSGKRPIGITSINIPIANSDAMNRSVPIEMDKISDGSGGTESALVTEEEYFQNLKEKMPKILGYIFDVLCRALNVHDDIKTVVKPTHRLADFLIWAEAISIALGNENGEFLKAWQLNVDCQGFMVIQNNSLAQLLLNYSFEHRDETEYLVEPQQLLNNLKSYANTKNIEYSDNKYLPNNEVWLTREINKISSDLRICGLIIETDVKNAHRRYIRFKKDQKAYSAYCERQRNVDHPE